MLCAGLCLPPGLYKYTYATKTPRHKPCSLQVEAVRVSERQAGTGREGLPLSAEKLNEIENTEILIE